MRRAPPGRFKSLAQVTVAILMVAGVLLPAQDVTEPALKAAFIYNFALFTEWPADALAARAPIVICVIGDAGVSDAVQREVKGRALSGHAMTVTRVTPPAALPRQCHVLYISGTTVAQASDLIAGVRDTPVLMLSDVPGFADAGGIGQFYFEHGQLRFIVNVASAKRARLQISSRLLSLAKRP